MQLTPPRYSGGDSSPSVTKLLAAVPDEYRVEVLMLLSDRRRGGRGLRSLLGLYETECHPTPAELPAALIEIYLRDHEAEPLHDCADCGLHVPVSAGRRYGHEATVDREYFPHCPCCGGRTGRHAFWSARRPDNAHS